MNLKKLIIILASIALLAVCLRWGVHKVVNELPPNITIPETIEEINI